MKNDIESILSDTVSDAGLPPDADNVASNEILIQISDNMNTLVQFMDECVYQSLMDISEKQDNIYMLFEDTLERIPEQDSKELYEADLLDTLHSIDTGIVSQNALLEENNRLLEKSMCTVSDNSVSQNAIMTTKLEDYGLTDSLLLVIVVLLSILLFLLIFVRRG